MKARDGTAADRADLIVRNAKITTLQSNGSLADALPVRGEKCGLAQLGLGCHGHVDLFTPGSSESRVRRTLCS